MKPIVVKCRGAALVDVHDLVPFQGNLKDLSEKNYNKFKKKILDLGFSEPFSVWDNEGKPMLLNGHQRHRVITRMIKEGHKCPKLPVSLIEADTLKEAKKKVLALTSQYGEITKEGLYEFMTESGLDFQEIESSFRFPEIDLDSFKIEFIDDNTVPPGEDDGGGEPPVEPKSKRGDLWTLGRHKILCGDSTQITDVELLLGSENADITLTSPPYNVSKQGFQDAKYDTGFEDKTDEDYDKFLYDFTSICLEKSSYVFINHQLLANNRGSLIEYQYKFKQFVKDILIWNKKICPPNICKGAFNTKWEYVFVFSKDSRTRGFPCQWQGQYPNVIETESNSGNEFAAIHKAGFPVAFPTWIIEKMDFAKTVYDPFCGTGTTLVACETTKRTCFGMEISPQYVDVILNRWAKLKQQDPVRDDGVTWSSLQNMTQGNDKEAIESSNGKR